MAEGHHHDWHEASWFENLVVVVGVLLVLAVSLVAACAAAAAADRLIGARQSRVRLRARARARILRRLVLHAHGGGAHLLLLGQQEAGHEAVIYAVVDARGAEHLLVKLHGRLVVGVAAGASMLLLRLLADELLPVGQPEGVGLLRLEVRGVLRAGRGGRAVGGAAAAAANDVDLLLLLAVARRLHNGHRDQERLLVLA